MLTAILCAVVGAVANRFSGSDNVEWLPGRNIYWAALAVAALAFFTLGPWHAAFLLVGCLTYRLPGWYQSIDMGVNEHSVARDAKVMFARTLMFAPAFIPLGFVAMVFGTVLAACLATMSYMLGAHVLRPKMGESAHVVTELLAGLSLGVVYGLLL